MKRKLDAASLIISVVMGVAWCLLGAFLYKLLKDSVWMPAIIGIYFLGLALAELAALKISNAFNGSQSATRKDRTAALLLVFGICVGGLLFEFLYELTPAEKTHQSTSYIFLIDNSDSMTWNDPTNTRSDGVRSVLDNCPKDFPVAVYKFNHYCQQVYGMTEAGNAPRSIDFQDNGGTNIDLALDTVLNDLMDGTLPGGSAPRILLLSDGEDDDDLADLSSVLKKANDVNATVCTISLGGYGEENLRRISEKAGGIHISVSDVSMLSNAFTTVAAANTEAGRDLLTYRSPTRLNWMYMLMRIIFLSILGGLMIGIKGFLSRTGADSNFNPLPAYLAAVLAGALSMELGINLLRLPALFMQAVMCALFVLVLNIRSSVTAEPSEGEAFSVLDPDRPASGGGRFGHRDDYYPGRHDNDDDDSDDKDDGGYYPGTDDEDDW